MSRSVKPIPDGFQTVSPHLVMRNAAEAIEFYKRAFGAEELGRMCDPSGKSIMHALLRIGNSMVMLNDESPEMACLGPQSLGGSSVTMHLYVEDADAAYQRAIDAGAKATMPVQEMFWGDRYGKLTDPFGHEWSIATHVKDVTPEEMEKAAALACTAEQK